MHSIAPNRCADREERQAKRHAKSIEITPVQQLLVHTALPEASAAANRSSYLQEIWSFTRIEPAPHAASHARYAPRRDFSDPQLGARDRPQLQRQSQHDFSTVTTRPVPH